MSAALAHEGFGHGAAGLGRARPARRGRSVAGAGRVTPGAAARARHLRAVPGDLSPAHPAPARRGVNAGGVARPLDGRARCDVPAGAPRAATSPADARQAGKTGGLVPTRAGRLALTLVVMMSLIGVLALAKAATGEGSTGSGAPAVAGARTVLVQDGDTLSGLAQQYLPAMEVQDAVVRIQLANGMSTDRLLAGQDLLIPIG